MNKSKNINPRECRTCGKCCKWFSIGYKKNFLLNKNEGDLEVFSELQRYLDLETDNIFVSEDEDTFNVIFNFPCQHLRFNKGIYSCKIYSGERPLICELYPYKPNFCEKFVKPINVFRNSADFLKRVKDLSPSKPRKEEE